MEPQVDGNDAQDFDLQAWARLTHLGLRDGGDVLDGSARHRARNSLAVDWRGSKEVPTGTYHAILKATGIKLGRNND